MIVNSLFLVFSLFSGLITPDNNGVILVKTEGLHPQKGHIQINVYKTDKGFPTEDELAFKKFRFKVNTAKNEYVLPALPFGHYAIALFYDENSNGKLDTNIFGIPKEKTGASNNPKSFSVPSFDESKFELAGKSKVLNIHLK